ncbi:MAG TPA: GDSL-type esterase/lipase family protein [Blastocatellia bacterium]|nr:GDSL-type esterase/lipase family protein [Blastocatellia bacterium]
MSETPENKLRISLGLFCLALSLLITDRVATSHADRQSIEDPTGRAMLTFYAALQNTQRGEWVTRIVHYGDSHVAADILTGALRRSLQSGFGDAGPGFVLAGKPWPSYSRAGVSSRASSGWQADGLTQASLAADRRLGLAGVSLSTSRAGEWLSLTASGRYFDVYMLKQPGAGALDISLDAAEWKHNVSLSSSTFTADYVEVVAPDDSIHTIEIRTTSSGLIRVFGIAIEGERPGVTYDALGINGARASRPLQWDWRLLSSNLERRDPDLIIVAYGSNEVTDSDLDLEEYSANFATLLKRFREAAPRASILVLGPPDRAVREGRRWKTASRMAALIGAQRRAALKAGAAFYDLFNAMGGPGSVERWATLAQPLAQTDRVHLTAAGYRLVADWLYFELMQCYSQTKHITFS